MASIAFPCPKCSSVIAWRRSPQQRWVRTVSVPNRRPLPLAGSTRLSSFKLPNRSQSLILKAQVQEVVYGSSSNLSPVTSTKLEIPSNGKDAEVAEESSGQAAISDSAISTFMAEVSSLIKLVNSRDITELQLKQNDCELIIRKQEALPRPAIPAPVAMMQPHPQAACPPQTPMSQAGLPPTSAASHPPSAPAPALPPSVKGSKSSLTPLKCPMAGTFYQCPAPGEPPFVKVGDKVNKGQVICIIEAMKLMNEIEADQTGTVVEILVEDGKPVSVDMPLLVIQP